MSQEIQEADIRPSTPPRKVSEQVDDSSAFSISFLDKHKFKIDKRAICCMFPSEFAKLIQLMLKNKWLEEAEELYALNAWSFTKKG